MPGRRRPKRPVPRSRMPALAELEPAAAEDVELAPAAEIPLPLPAPAAPSVEQQLGALERDLAERFPEPPPPPPPVADGAAPTNPDDDLRDGLELVSEHPELLADFAEEDFADLFQLLFGLLADWRGPHWELPDKSARRLGKWWLKIAQKHPELVRSAAEHLPELVGGVLLTLEVARRWVEDRKVHALSTPAPAAA